MKTALFCLIYETEQAENLTESGFTIKPVTLSVLHYKIINE